MTDRLLVANAALITMDPKRPACFNGWLRVGADGRITGIGEGSPGEGNATEVIDAGGAFVAPGFISGHSHLSTSGSRGLGHDSPLYAWADHMTRYTRHCDAEDIYWVVLHGALDFLGNGITTAYDFCDSRLPFIMEEGRKARFGPFKPAAYGHEQIRAKVDAGLRFINSVLINDQVGSDAEIEERFGESLAFAEGLNRSDLHLGHAISGSVQWADDASTAVREVAIMRRYGVINQPHFLETSEQLDLQRSKFAWYEEAGALGPDLVFGHFIHPTEEMKCKCAACGCAMIWQPTSNGRLASGFADIPGLVELGMRVGVGLDDQSCTDVSDPWQNMRMGIYMQRAFHRDPKAMGVAQMLRLHTLGTAEALGIADRVGSLEVGKFGDFLLVDPRSPDLGPVWDPLGTYVLACSLRNLKGVYVGGGCVSRDGASTHPLATRASEELHARLGRIAAGF
ncbi:Cytosine/adenosine deaminase [Faunimonas pinastri]|uniref:Cytosine/adenosine deaminase n=1 Tax=Faunimonas pinastri TaxID=1855383 RepID=A0A1H9EPC9_9HYPH|nr:amidohydrolase family protein [Faunimonas pinastri]SEQ27462.1 Cytosine/adenosine deaminase [Faunimonas pinastri]